MSERSYTDSEPMAFINTRLADLAEANALYGKDMRLNAPDKIARNDREISWLKELKSILALAQPASAVGCTAPPSSPVLCAGGIDPGWDACTKCGATMDDDCAFSSTERA